MFCLASAKICTNRVEKFWKIEALHPCSLPLYPSCLMLFQYSLLYLYQVFGTVSVERLEEYDGSWWWMLWCLLMVVVGSDARGRRGGSSIFSRGGLQNKNRLLFWWWKSDRHEESDKFGNFPKGGGVATLQPSTWILPWEAYTLPHRNLSNGPLMVLAWQSISCSINCKDYIPHSYSSVLILMLGF